jgi:hypothetical protein
MKGMIAINAFNMVKHKFLKPTQHGLNLKIFEMGIKVILNCFSNNLKLKVIAIMHS